MEEDWIPEAVMLGVAFFIIVILLTCIVCVLSNCCYNLMYLVNSANQLSNSIFAGSQNRTIDEVKVSVSFSRRLDSVHIDPNTRYQLQKRISGEHLI